MSVYSKIVEVMKALGAIKKDGSNSYQNFSYQSVDAILTAVRGAMADNNLVCIPAMTSVEIVGEQYHITYTFTLVDADDPDSSITHEWFQAYPVMATSKKGNSVTKYIDDKAIGKATSYAHKYFLKKLFLITDKEDEREDIDGHDTTKHTTGQQQQNQPKQRPQDINPPTIKDPRGVSDLQRIARATDIKYLNEIKMDTGGSLKNPRYVAFCDYQDGDRTDSIKIYMYNEHIESIIACHQIEDWEKNTRGFYPHRQFNKTLFQPGILTMWDDKAHHPKFDECEATFESDSIRRAFFHRFKDVDSEILMNALQVTDSKEYKGDLKQAIQAVQDYIEEKAEDDEQARRQQIPDIDEAPTIQKAS